MSWQRSLLIWGLLAVVLGVPIAAATFSPLLAWRQPVYIAAGFSGILAMVLLVAQPLLAGGQLPGLHRARGRVVHRITGSILVCAVILHVAGLWVTSPPDVVDALLFVSPTQFSVWGVIAMWAVFGAAVLAVYRKRVALRFWRLAHTGLAVLTVVGSVVHALLIEGTMEPLSKFVLCAVALLATFKTAIDLRSWAIWRRS